MTFTSIFRRCFCTRSDNFSRRGSHMMTKIVGTIGPVSEGSESMQKLVDEGLYIMRMNFSHATYDEAKNRLINLQSSKGVHSKYGSKFNLRASLLDTQGPEIRTGGVSKNYPDKKIKLEEGSTITLTTSEEKRDECDDKLLWISYKDLPQSMKSGDRILLDDGLIELEVTSNDYYLSDSAGFNSSVESSLHSRFNTTSSSNTIDETIECRVLNSGLLGSRKGVNLPNIKTNLPPMTKKDMEDIRWGIKEKVDFIAASFIRSASHVRQIRGFIEREHLEYCEKEGKDPYDLENNPPPRIISKIENAEGIKHFDGILEESDGIMVARGDLGVEIPLQDVFMEQKKMVRKANRMGRPVIVATQMLDSMMQNPRPTRAEVSDVGNAVLDGADCVMLSGETANGKFPVESVRVMREILKEADDSSAKYGLHPRSKNKKIAQVSWPIVGGSMSDPRGPSTVVTMQEAVASAAVQTANDVSAKLILVLCRQGMLARLVSKYRPDIPVMCFCRAPEVGRQLQIYRGLHPHVLGSLNDDDDKGKGFDAKDEDHASREAVRAAKELGWIRRGDRVVIVMTIEERKGSYSTGSPIMRCGTVD